MKQFGLNSIFRCNGSLLRAFARNEEGGAIITASLLIILVLMGMFALSIDTNQNYMTQSDLQGKLKAYSPHLAMEYRAFKIREMAEQIASDTSNSNMQVKTEPSLKLLPGRPLVGTNGGTLSDAAARDILAAEMLKLLKNDKLVNTTSKVFVDVSCGPPNATGRSMLVNFAAIKPQQDVFAKGSLGKSVCTSKNEPGCITVDQTVDLILSCDPKGPGTLPPEASTLAPESGKCGTDSAYTMPKDDGIIRADSNSNLLNTPAVLDLAMSLDNATKGDGPQIKSFTSGLRAILAKGGISENSIAAGLTIGNRPIIGGGVTSTPHAELGYGSGSLFDPKASISNGTGVRKSNVSRNWSFEGGFWAEDVRACGNRPSDLIWTYKKMQAGSCYEVQSVPQGTVTYVSGDTPSDPPACVGSVGDHWLGTPYEVKDNTIDEVITCNKYDTVSPFGCIEDRITKTRMCNMKVDQPVYTGEWYASCRAGLTQAEAYKSPKDMMKLDLWYSRTLDKGVDKSALRFGPIPGTIEEKPMTAVEEQLPRMLESKLQKLHKKNTDRAWYWGCRGAIVSIGSPSFRASPQGSLGEPYGDIAGKPLAAANGADINEAITPDPITGSVCPLPAPRAKSAQEFSVKFALPGCADNSGTGCDLPEGMYRVELTTSGLQPSRKPTGDIYPDNSVQTSWRTGDNGEWALNEGATVAPANLGFECPNVPGKYQSTKNVFPPATNHVKYALKRGAGTKAEENLVVETLPAEQLNIAGFGMERRRDQGAPYVCNFDTGGGDFTGSPKAAYVQNKNNNPGFNTATQCGTYPWFCNPAWPLDQRESEFWNRPGNFGILAFNGDKGGNTTMPLGIETGGAAVYKAYKNYNGMTDTQISAAWKSVGEPQLIQMQALDTVKVKKTDVAPPNLPITFGQLYNVLGVAGAGFDSYDIHEGHGFNQCALLKASIDKMKSGFGTASGTGYKGTRMIGYIGNCPKTGDEMYNAQEAYWNAHGSMAGAYSRGVANFQLTNVNFPTSGNVAACMYAEAMDAAKEGILVFPMDKDCVNGMGANIFNAYASTVAAISQISPGLGCSNPQCDMADPLDSIGSCVSRFMSCLMPFVRIN